MKTVLLLIAIILMGVVSITLAPIVFIFTFLSVLIKRESAASYCKVVAIGVDQMLGSILYKTEDWTISSYTYWLSTKNQMGAVIFSKVIDFFAYPFQRNHCATAYQRESEEIGMNPDEYRKKSKEIGKKYQ